MIETLSGIDAAALAGRIPPAIRIGTSSWNYPGWRGLVYHRDYEGKGTSTRMLEEYARQLRPDLKTHLAPPRGIITKVFHDRGYGFITAEGDGHDVYFHRNSVLDEKFEKLTVGTKVRYAEEDGDKGPQASTVHVLGTS